MAPNGTTICCKVLEFNTEVPLYIWIRVIWKIDASIFLFFQNMFTLHTKKEKKTRIQTIQFNNGYSYKIYELLLFGLSHFLFFYFVSHFYDSSYFWTLRQHLFLACFHSFLETDISTIQPSDYSYKICVKCYTFSQIYIIWSAKCCASLLASWLFI